MTESRRGADVVVDCLAAAGVRYVFGLPGDTGVALYDALYRTKTDLKHVLTRDERHAAVMADAYARATNEVGVVEVSSGGGVSYVVGGLGEAFAAGIPVLVVTSDVHSRSRGTGALTEIDQLAMFSGCTKWRKSVSHAAEIPGAITEAFRAVTSGRPAPVVVIVPEDVLDEPAENVESAAFTWPAGEPHLGAVRPEASGTDVARAAALLAHARRPVIVAGSGVHMSAASAALEEFATRLAIPVATTIHGKGALAETNPLALGVVGNNGGLPFVNDYVASADVAILIGTRANATDTNSFRAPNRSAAKVVQIDIDSQRIGRTYADAAPLVGDARAVLAQLGCAVPAVSDTTRVERERQLVELRRAWAETERASSIPGPDLVPRDVIRILSDRLGSALVAVDPGTPTPNVAAYWRLSRAGRTIIAPRGHGPMGYAIPAAIGLAFARPQGRVVAVTADGSFAMACGELETAARYDLPILFVQFTNHSLGWIKMLQHLYYGKRYFSVDPGPIDAVSVARACGLAASKPTSVHDLEEAVDAFVREPQPTYLDIDVPHMIDLVPPVSAWTETLTQGGGRAVY